MTMTTPKPEITATTSTTGCRPPLLRSPGSRSCRDASDDGRGRTVRSTSGTARPTPSPARSGRCSRCSTPDPAITCWTSGAAPAGRPRCWPTSSVHAEPWSPWRSSPSWRRPHEVISPTFPTGSGCGPRTGTCSAPLTWRRSTASWCPPWRGRCLTRWSSSSPRAVASSLPVRGVMLVVDRVGPDPSDVVVDRVGRYAFVPLLWDPPGSSSEGGG